MSSNNLLVELFVEELPPKVLKKLGDSFAGTILEVLKAQALTGESSTATAYASPRRLAVHITAVSSQAEDKAVSQKLMPVTVGLDANGNATPALVKKLNALGADESAFSKLKRENDGKADILFYDALVKGASLSEGLQKAVEEALSKLPIPKVMTYQLGDGWESVNFVRPAHGLVALHGNTVVPLSVLGLQSSNHTQGHRFEASVSPVVIKDADSYEAQMQNEGAVIPSFDARRAEIVRQLTAAAQKQNLKPIEDDALLDEVTALVERPNVLLGQFETEFLEVPQECLILTMKANQKYFPLLDANDKLTNKFLIVSNISPADPFKVVDGNERVVRPRLADAKFFFDQDRKKTLASRLSGLEKVVYHNKLGTQAERSKRVSDLAKAIASKIGDANLATKAEQAAQLSKVDLLTDMVGEFPELQGIMGRYYAQHEKLDNDIAFAIEDHYKPRFAGDELPRSIVGIAVAIADKLETLVGLFSIGEKPTGDKDPFALRRQALGIIRMLIECKLNISFETIIDLALQQFKVEDKAGVLAAITEFCFDRLSVNLREQGASAQEVDAVLALNPSLLSEIPKRLEAVRAFSSLDEAPALAAANKRVGNILKKIEGNVEAKINDALLQEPAEKALASTLAKIKPEADALFESGDYTNSLKALAALKAPVDDFFDNVMVNADDPALKANRQGLLATLHQAMNRVADLSKLAA
ncbi:glycine--tRNA ligase subunit beta [Candidatus Methylopumilus turicensis]|uniref:Glycine--tRNA ligase beta subunit n=1 Tax=Candidatus Methylopumilus turicensis TaxID=1581680 RepID=A0A0B7IVP0_9PROT|nr:glycine--tRNA ligase subunit beta [Candidatus Methylopumilus turicensis]CEN56391.1 glycine tRNA synthetase, beta subunit [Candidatus Methylopumilus turicensis]